MYRQIFSFVATLVIGLAVGAMGTYLLTSSQIEGLVAMSYLRSASDARSFAQVIEDLKTHQDAQAASRLEGYLSAALISLSDYESVS